MNSENKNELETSVITNDTNPLSSKNECNDIGNKCDWKNKIAVREYIRMYRANNREKIRTQNQKSYFNYKEKNDKRNLKYYYENKDTVKQVRQIYLTENKAKVQAQCKKYELENKEKIKRYKKNKRETDPNYKLACNLRRRLKRALKNKQKVGSAIRDLGCSVNELKLHLENQFQPGMTWNNHSPTGWHIDHIIPLSAFNLENKTELLKACHYTNLQPLWAADNIFKGKKLIPVNVETPNDVLQS